MASLCLRILSRHGRSIYKIPSRSGSQFPDIMDHATGKELKELKALHEGNDDPWMCKPIKRGVGTKEEPNLIPSAFDDRIVGCICHEDTTHIKWLWLDKGEPKRCQCGHWFKLVYKKPL